MSRIIGQRIGEALGQPVTFENIFLEAGVEKAIKAPRRLPAHVRIVRNVALLPCSRARFIRQGPHPVGRFVIQRH